MNRSSVSLVGMWLPFESDFLLRPDDPTAGREPRAAPTAGTRWGPKASPGHFDGAGSEARSRPAAGTQASVAAHAQLIRVAVHRQEPLVGVVLLGVNPGEHIGRIGAVPGPAVVEQVRGIGPGRPADHG
jgi:hypothetical protein